MKNSLLFIYIYFRVFPSADIAVAQVAAADGVDGDIEDPDDIFQPLFPLKKTQKHRCVIVAAKMFTVSD